MMLQCLKDSLEHCCSYSVILYEIEANPEVLLVLLFTQGSTVQSFTTICINLQMWRPYGTGSSRICLSQSFRQNCFRIVPDKVAHIFKVKELQLANRGEGTRPLLRLNGTEHQTVHRGVTVTLSGGGSPSGAD